MSGEERAAFKRAFYDQLDAVPNEPDSSVSVEDDPSIKDVSNASEPGDRADGVDVQDNGRPSGETDVDGTSEDASEHDREETDEGASGSAAESPLEGGGGISADTSDERVVTQDQTNERSSNQRTFGAIPHVYDFESRNV